MLVGNDDGGDDSSRSARRRPADDVRAGGPLGHRAAVAGARGVLLPGARLERVREGGNECATLEVRVDYGDPAAGTIELALLRAPAEEPDARVGSLVVNPGGPGAPGTQTAKDADAYFGGPLLEPLRHRRLRPARHRCSSDPVDCLSDEELDAFIAGDPTPDDAGEGEEYTEERGLLRGLRRQLRRPRRPRLDRRGGARHGRAARGAARGDAELLRLLLRHHASARRTPSCSRRRSVSSCSTAPSTRP